MVERRSSPSFSSGKLLNLMAATAVAFTLEACTVVDAQTSPDEVWVGNTTIKKGVNVRTEPRIPESSQEAPNTIAWDSVCTINGKDVRGVEEFTVTNAQVKYGQSADFGQNSSQIHDPWLMLKVEVEELGGLVKREKRGFVNAGNQTREFVQPEKDIRVVKNTHSNQ